MELGTIQKRWIGDLRKYPERQINGRLGTVDLVNGEMKACCLGQGILTLCEIKGIKPTFIGNSLYDNNSDFWSYPVYSYKELGLINDRGNLINNVESSYFGRSTKLPNYYSLSQMNDGGITWLEIADYIEANPENVFIESV